MGTSSGELEMISRGEERGRGDGTKRRKALVAIRGARSAA